ncbi:unextended protein [Harmonia axyridis]|uniref:unextended protein n=1 Tax=Harmonia axyridis TaxID=115357 RepID=UPI001E275208|nr:unextended protein [Harmonia axyridis]
MAVGPYHLAQIFCIFLLANSARSTPTSAFTPEFNSLKVVSIKPSCQNEDYNKIEFEIQGRNIVNGIRIKATKIPSERNTLCTETLDVSYNISDVATSEFKSARYVLIVPKSVEEKIYLCLPHNLHSSTDKIPASILNSAKYLWYHQGNDISIDLTHQCAKDNQNARHRSRRDEVDDKAINVLGLRVEIPHKNIEMEEESRIPKLLANVAETIRLFGTNFDEEMVISFTPEEGERGSVCQLQVVKGVPVDKANFSPTTTLVTVKLPPLPEDAKSLYLCVKKGNASFIHQGTDPGLQVVTYESLLPLWVAIVVIVTCLSFSSLFSGLNLGLMSMDMTELKILCNTGTPREQKYAKTIIPVRRHGNYLLCSILLANVFVNNIFTILLDDLTSGAVAVISSTLAIVTFGEISPQAICSRFGLAIGAKTIYITKFVMILTFPLSYPVSKFLDWLLGEEIGNYYNRERLNELVKVTTGVNDLDKDEVNIISGALELRKKTVAEVMTKIEDVFMLDYEAVLDFETVSEIMKSGFSRVPVFEGNRQNIVTMLYIKDLAFVDPDDNTPLKTLCQFYQNPCNFVFEDVTLDVMFKIFKEGNKGHMAFVHRVNNEGEGDPFYETIGLITLEDVIEELIQAEIMDETDVFTDNRSKRKRIADRTRQDFSIFADRKTDSYKIRISPQLTLAAYQFLSTSVESFHPNVLSETILKRLLKQDIVCLIKKNKNWRSDAGCIIYQQGKSADYFVLVLEGRVEVTVGKENLTFEGGPFTYFGTQALIQSIGVAESPSIPTSTLGSLESLNIDSLLKHSFQPDYTVRACTEVLYLLIKRSLYLAAKRATLMEKSQKDNQTTGEQFDEEVDKLLHSLEEDGSTGAATPRKTSKNVIQAQGEAESMNAKVASSRNASIFSNTSPQKDVNGRLSNADLHNELQETEEEMSLLSNKS